MHQYLQDTEYAASKLFEILAYNRQELLGLEEEQRSALAKEACYEITFRQREMQSHANYWHGLFCEAVDSRMNLDNLIAQLQAQIFDKQFSLSAIAGAVFQIAKQGISVVHQNKESCPPGRTVHGVQLKEIIWAARNQSLHFEEGKVKPHTAQVFDSLFQNGAGDIFANYNQPVNLAHDVFILLGWNGYTAYKKDLISLL